jgi:rhodanese-related sulfurtransferase
VWLRIERLAGETDFEEARPSAPGCGSGWPPGAAEGRAAGARRSARTGRISAVITRTGTGIDGVLTEARRGVRRYTPHETVAALRRGALVVDTRTETQRAETGELPGAVVIDRTVLEWRLDPASDARIPEATGYDLEIVVVCRQGYSSSLAAESLRRLGLHRATDLIGGVEAWQQAGLPLHRDHADVRR